MSIAEKIARPVIVCVFLNIEVKLARKRELAQFNPFELVVLLTISNTVQNAIIGNNNGLLGGLLDVIRQQLSAQHAVPGPSGQPPGSAVPPTPPRCG